MKVKFKKGQKVIRFSGYSFGNPTGMYTGCIGTVSKDQVLPGKVELEEFPGVMGHDPDRLLRIDNLPEKLKKYVIKNVKSLSHEEIYVRHQILSSFIEGYRLGSKNA